VPDPRAYGVCLGLFTLLLLGRVLGQLLVATRAPAWLPPMDRWQSGLLPYPALLVSQAIVLALMTSIAVDFSRAAGFWVEPQPLLGPAALWWSYLYVAAMIVRYGIRMARFRDQRWLGGTIPVVFHCVVAAFQWTFGTFHQST
jgi:hypothetical protein